MEIEKIQLIESEGKSIFRVTRIDLEGLVRESRLLKKNENLKKLKRDHFYAHDLYSMKRLQHHKNFLVYGIGIFDKKNEYIIFNGKKFDGSSLNGQDILFVVENLEHKTTARFVFGVCELIKINWQRYGTQFRNNSFIYYPITSEMQNYFKNKLHKPKYRIEEFLKDFSVN
jgi:hypothetical protein